MNYFVDWMALGRGTVVDDTMEFGRGAPAAVSRQLATDLAG
jgi:hypothetical protein